MQIEIREPKSQEITPQEKVVSPTRTELNQNSTPDEHITNNDADSTQQPHAKQSVEEQEVKKVSNALEQFWKAMGVSLQFHVDEDSNKIQVSIVDPSTNKVIRKIPSDELLDMAAAIRDSTGVFVDMDL